MRPSPCPTNYKNIPSFISITKTLHALRRKHDKNCKVEVSFTLFCRLIVFIIFLFQDQLTVDHSSHNGVIILKNYFLPVVFE